jgi:hypothetical protein
MTLLKSKLHMFQTYPQDVAYDDVLKAHQDIMLVVHTPSPFTFTAEDYKNEILNPALYGTANILKGPEVLRASGKTYRKFSSVVSIVEFTILVLVPPCTLRSLGILRDWRKQELRVALLPTASKAHAELAVIVE